MKYQRLPFRSNFLGALALLAVTGLISACGDAGFDGTPDGKLKDGRTESVYRPLNTCDPVVDCAADEACTQGGRCVNITGERDAAPVLQADIDELADPRGAGVPYTLPANAILRLDDADGDGTALHIRDKMIFDGQGSLLIVEDDAIGIRVAQPAEWTVLRNFKIQGTEPARENESIGVDARAHGIRLDNIQFARLGTGVRAHTTVDGEYANVNTQQWARLTLDEIYHYGLTLRAGDANAGLMTSIDIRDGAGIYDRSFLGNTHIGVNVKGSRNHSVTFASNAGRNSLFGAHIAEGDPAPQSASKHDLFVGGDAIARVEGSGDRIGSRASRVNFHDPDKNHESSDPGLAVRVPGGPNSAISWNHPAEGDRWYMRYWDHSSRLSWGISYRNTGTSPFFWTGARHSQGPGVMRYN